MNKLVRFRYMSQNITFIFRRLAEPEYRLSSFKPYNILPCSFQCVKTCSTLAGTKNFVDKEHDDSVPVPNSDDFDTHFVTNGDPDLEKKLKVLILEVDIMRQEGERVPTSIKPDQWKQLINMATRSMRKRFLSFLWKNEIKKTNDKLKKDERRKIREEELSLLKQQPDDGHIRYGLTHNSIFMRVYDATITQYDNYRLIRAMQFSQKVVVDCGYDKHMTSREALNCAKQLMLLFAENRFHPDPFNLYFCNVNRDGLTMKELQKFINTLYDDAFPLNITEKSYLELFPKQNLVYLTPHCREELHTFDHDDVYIIGAMVDKVNQEPLSLAKAKKEGLRMAKLPLDRYLSWGCGSGKSLTLNHMIQILLDIRFTGDWRKALQHVPRRKILQDDGKQEQHLRKHEAFKNKVFKNKYRTASQY